MRLLDGQVTVVTFKNHFFILITIPVCITSFHSHTGAVKAYGILYFPAVEIDAQES